MGLFENTNQPLSRRMMPATIEDFVGQAHLIEPGNPIDTMLTHHLIHSMIFYGPPATGKTSLAKILANTLQYHFITTNALTLDSEQIRSILKTAEQNSLAGERTVVFIDEIHRLIKPKQDAFLSAMENGIVTVIGATTENPYFILQPSFRSRLFIYEFKELNESEFNTILERALQKDVIMSKMDISFDEDARQTLLNLSKDVRMMLNTLEMVALSKNSGSKMVITSQDILKFLQKIETRYSKKSGHYDTISAFIKSVRGSDPDAAIYYLALMLESGEDPLFIARRLIILAAEDIGLAYPEGLPIAVACYNAIERIGMPEGRLVLAMTTGLLAGVPKSNSTTKALDRASWDISSGKVMQVPPNLSKATLSGERDSHKGLQYLNPHDFPKHYVEQKYTQKPVSYFQPGELGFEKRIKSWLEGLKGSTKFEG